MSCLVSHIGWIGSTPAQTMKARRPNLGIQWGTKHPRRLQLTFHHGFNSHTSWSREVPGLWKRKAFYQCSSQSCIGLQDVDKISPTYYQDYRIIDVHLITIITISIQQLLKMTIPDCFFWAMVEIRKVRLCTPWTEPQAIGIGPPISPCFASEINGSLCDSVDSLDISGYF